MGSQAVTVPCLDRRWVIRVGELGEFGLVARIIERLAGPPAGTGVVIGPGDDAAVLAVPDGRVVTTTDLLIEGRHFRLDWSTGYDVGRKAAAQNLADVAAMGARPTALLLGLGVPAQAAVAWIDALVDGMRDEGDAVGARVVGGDVVSTEQITIAVTALGELDGGSPVTRSGAAPGDLVAVAGRLGHAAAGVALLRAGQTAEALADPAAGPRDAAVRPAPAGGEPPPVEWTVARAVHEVIDAHRRPHPPYGLGPAAAMLGATAMVDVSDGLAADLGHVAAASGVRIELTSAALPISPPLALAAELTGTDPLRYVLAGGDDHALAATFPAGTELPAAWTVIGRVLTGGSGLVVDGRPVEYGGWDHFG